MDGRITEKEGAGSRFDGFLLSIEEGRTLGGIRNVEATEILRRNEGADHKEQEKALIKYAKERGCWYNLRDITKKYYPLPHPGAESIVYSDGYGKYVLIIEGEEPMQHEIDQYMEWKGFKKYKNIGSYIFDVYKFTDLLPNNFIKTRTGRLHCIDPMIRLNI